MKKAVIRQKVGENTIQITSSTLRYDVYNNKNIINSQIALQVPSNNQITLKYTKNSYQYQVLKKQHQNFREFALFQFLAKMTERRKRYSFQMLKLLYLFPDDSFSENVSINSYDRLFFQDQHVHTIVKIYETKQMEAKIWAFLNLKTFHKFKKLEKFTNKIQTIQKKIITRCQKATFQTIQQYSIRIKPQRALNSQNVVISQQEGRKIKTQSFQSVKTQKNQYMIRSTNQVIRAPPIQIQPVKRIYMDLNDPSIRVVYPTTQTKILNSKDILQRYKNNLQKSSIRQVTTTVNQSQEKAHHINMRSNSCSKIIENSHTYVKQNDNTRIIYPPRIRFEQSRHMEQSINNNTVKKIQPVTIRATPSNTYYSRAEIVTPRSETKYLSKGQNPVVQTVNGDCTINIHNGCSHSDDKTQNISSSSSRYKSVGHYKRNRNQSPNSIVCHNSCQSMAYNNCYPAYHQPIMVLQTMCSCQQYYNNGYCTGMCQNNYMEINNANRYCIQERIQYLKNLQEMNRPQSSRLYKKK